jgi:hypothetical protein
MRQPPRRALALALLATALAPQAFAQPLPLPLALEGTEVRRIRSRVLERDYELYVGLPPSYATSPTRTYPVVFVTDAPYAFPLVRSIARRISDHGRLLQEFILVGIFCRPACTWRWAPSRPCSPAPATPGSTSAATC